MTHLRILFYLMLGTGALASEAADSEPKARAKPGSNQEVLGYGIDGNRYKTACPDYKHYAVVPQYVLVSCAAENSRTY